MNYKGLCVGMHTGLLELAAGLDPASLHKYEKTCGSVYSTAQVRIFGCFSLLMPHPEVLALNSAVILNQLERLPKPNFGSNVNI